MVDREAYREVTIMIPTYNQEQYIQQCVASCLAQTYPSLEIVIGDDNSTDRTPELLAQFSSDPRVHIVRNETNLGRVANYHNMLYRHARGEWVLNLDGDDYLSDPEAISTLVSAVPEAPDSVIVFGTVQRLDDHQGVEADPPRRAASAPPEVIHGSVLARDYWKTDRGLKHAGALYHRKTALETGFYELDIISSDIDSLLRLALRGSVVIVDAPVAIWRIHGGNESAHTSIEQRLANLGLVDHVQTALRECLGASTANRWTRRMRRRMLRGTFVSFLRLSRPAQGWLFLRRAARSPREWLTVVLSLRFMFHLVFRR